MQQIQFIGTSPTELISEIKKAIVSDLRMELAKEFEQKEPTEYFTRKEVCELLHIDLSTLYRWTKRGAFQSYQLQGRIYYKRSEIELKIENSKIN